MKKLRTLARQMLGINRRNHDLITRYNPRSVFQVVDHKLKAKAALSTAQLPIVETLAVYRIQRDISQFAKQSQHWQEFVIKPAQGAGGGGVVVVSGKKDHGFRLVNDDIVQVRELEGHLSDILGGIFSLNQRYDEAMIERRVHAHPLLTRLSFRGLPDIRVLVFRGIPIMAMLRVATRASHGRANLHAGGVGIGIDITTGVTTYAVEGRRWISCHPDTHSTLGGITLPNWNELLTIAARCADAVALGYLGVDLTIDAERGPCVLELNARPGLSIQLTNRRGLRPLIEAVEQRVSEGMTTNERVQLGREIACEAPLFCR